MAASLVLRSASLADQQALARICFDVFGELNARHGFPPDFPTHDVAAGFLGFMIGNPQVYSVVAEADGKLVGSNFLWEAGMIAGVGPITVASDAQGGVGRRLMEDVLARARAKRFAGVRLVQAAFNRISMSLYTKLGFDIRELLVCITGAPMNKQLPGFVVRPAATDDVEACAALCQQVHGHDRSEELTGAVLQSSAAVALQNDRIVAYTTGIGFFGHTVALENSGLKALIAAAPQFQGPGFLLPSRNGEAFRWCLANGLRVVQPLTLMSLGLYNEPRGAFLPSILF